MTLSDIARFQPKAWSILTRSFASDRVASTYLLWGREGLGHWPLAVSFAALLNCEELKNKDKRSADCEPCGVCRNCHLINSLAFGGFQIVVPISTHKNLDEGRELTNQFLDQKREEPFRVVSSAVHTGIPVDLAREVKSRLALKADPGIKRVVLFYQMDKMLHASADALLKMIEEPPLDTVIILTAETPDALLKTIQSRSQRIRLDRVPEKIISEYLVSRYEIATEKSQRIARLSEGIPGTALEMIGAESEEELSIRAVGFMLFKAMFTENNPALASHVIELIPSNDRGQAESVLKLWLSLIRDCSFHAATGETSDMINTDFQSEIIAFSRRFEDPNLASTMTSAIKNTLADFRRNVHISTALVALVLKLGMAIRASR